MRNIIYKYQKHFKTKILKILIYKLDSNIIYINLILLVNCPSLPTKGRIKDGMGHN